MKLHIKNKIDLDGQVELVEQSYPVKLTEKNGHIYLAYTNEEEETVMLKCNEQELVMTRYSTPKSIMRFHRDNPALVAIPTPLGYQHLMTETETYAPDFEKQRILIDYKLKQPDTGALFAEYQMEISWE
ncbi:DUF1934 domain-containing protein [Streptococcus pasteurianus]|uniref:DUF1934 domain-containing protein n=1 Tax=Streptococcus TaxID=1301 RepID=UPI000E405062|nr:MULTISPECIES: DUF1934 domain-containing protein [Streptococcus]MDK8394546.1 DUF1934 domain-containing protein [Streptococcus pasteurianus]RGB46200.1 DUF1934 domain-containing protein [Streptococcus gallolyticus]